MNWDRIAEEYLATAQEIFGPLRQTISDVADEMTRRLQAGSKIMICGNGGSAADAQHFAGELVNRFLREREPFAGLALSTDTSVLSSIGNDFGYDWVFEKQVRGLGKADDVLVGISTSGNAANVCRAVETAKTMNIWTVALTGGDGGQLAQLADTVVAVSCTTRVPRIQEGHQLVFHALCEHIEDQFVGSA